VKFLQVLARVEERRRQGCQHVVSEIELSEKVEMGQCVIGQDGKPISVQVQLLQGRGGEPQVSPSQRGQLVVRQVDLRQLDVAAVLEGQAQVGQVKKVIV